MSKKHFIAIAAKIREQLETTRAIECLPIKVQRITALIQTARNLCEVFADANPRFQSHRFLVACGFNECELNVNTF